MLVRLLRWPELAKLFGNPGFTSRTLRFAWHVTSVAWWGFAAILALLARPPVSVQPIDKPARSNDQCMWFGAKSMYDNAGFNEVARRKPQRPIVRIKLA